MEEKIPIEKIVIGPRLHTLTPEQKERVTRLTQTFAEVYPVGLEKAIANFEHDLHPEREIKVWESMERAYKQAIQKFTNTLDQRKEIYSIILYCTMTDSKNVLNDIKTKYLSREQAQSVIDIYLSST